MKPAGTRVGRRPPPIARGTAARRHAMAWLVAAALAVPPVGSAAAEHALRDPMRPPSEFLEQAQQQGTAAPTPQLVLQSVKISGTTRRAVINGIVVKPGDRLQGAVVSQIKAGEVVLRGDDGRQVLKLYPDIDKRAVTQPPGAGKHAPSRRANAAAQGGRR